MSSKPKTPPTSRSPCSPEAPPTFATPVGAAAKEDTVQMKRLKKSHLPLLFTTIVAINCKKNHMFDSVTNDGKEGDGKELDMHQIVEDASIFGFPKGVDDETHGNSVGDQAIAGIAIAMSSVLDVAVCPYIRHGQDLYHDPAMTHVLSPMIREPISFVRVVERKPP